MLSTIIRQSVIRGATMPSWAPSRSTIVGERKSSMTTRSLVSLRSRWTSALAAWWAKNFPYGDRQGLTDASP